MALNTFKSKTLAAKTFKAGEFTGLRGAVTHIDFIEISNMVMRRSRLNLVMKLTGDRR